MNTTNGFWLLTDKWLRGLLSVALIGLALCVSANEPRDIAIAQLPQEAREVVARIRAGGTFPYRQDGSVFGNRERMLPARERGYYREYTVPTPGARDRGARRIIAGGRDLRAPSELWYSDDHYNSFRRIRE